MEARKYYDDLLGGVYGWMSGDFTAGKNNFLKFLSDNDIAPDKTGLALDLGAGHGVQTAALLARGFQVLAVDFSRELLAELRQNNPSENLTVVEGSIENVADFNNPPPELIVCWGDTLAHLESLEAVARFLKACFSTLADNGQLVLSFRDYGFELAGNNRFIPVKSDESRIMTCFLEYAADKVTVTDIVYEKNGAHWQQIISSYQKVRLTRNLVLEMLENIGFEIIFNEIERGLCKIIASKS